MKNTTVTFIGHKDCSEQIKEKVKEEVEKLILNGYYNFLCGGVGRFDNICAKCVYELKKKYPYIKSNLVLPYYNFRIDFKDYYDEIILPSGAEKYYKSSIPRRNKYLVDNSSVAICFVKFVGNAKTTFEYAHKKNLKIINLAE